MIIINFKLISHQGVSRSHVWTDPQDILVTSLLQRRTLPSLSFRVCWVGSANFKTRGQWPYRPASKEGAMTIKPITLYDFNFPGIPIKKRDKRSCLQWGSYPRPFAPQSNTFIPMPHSLKEFGSFYFEVASFCTVFDHFGPLNDLGGHKQPQNQTQWPWLPMFPCFPCLSSFSLPCFKNVMESDCDPLTCWLRRR